MKTLNNISIRNKLILIQATTAFIALFICCSIFAYIGINTFKTATVRKTNSIARIVGANTIAPLVFMDPDAANKILEKLNNEPDIKEAVLFDKKGKVFAKYSRSSTIVDTNLIKKNFNDYDEKTAPEFSDDNFVVRNKIYQGNEFLGSLFVKVELIYQEKIIISYLVGSGLVLIAGLISALISSFFMQRAISGRLLALVTKTKEVAETGNYSSPVTYEGNDEIATLSKEFNTMLVQIANMESSLKEINQQLEQRVAERTAELETANKELEAFSYTVSHDLKAPLRAINGFTEILVSKYTRQLDDKAKEIAGVIIANAKKMGRLIEDLLEFSKVGRKEMIMTDVSMDEIVQKVLEDAISQFKERNVEIPQYGRKSIGFQTPGMKKERNVEVKIDKLPPARGDKNLLVQVWTNLIFNAFKYTGKTESAKIIIGYYRRGNVNVYYIKDNGAGFDMKYQDKLFKVFQRLHGADEFEGTGVGLANVHRIITRHGGRVWAEGIVNEGASFYFSLPVLD